MFKLKDNSHQYNCRPFIFRYYTLHLLIYMSQYLREMNTVNIISAHSQIFPFFKYLIKKIGRGKMSYVNIPID